MNVNKPWRTLAMQNIPDNPLRVGDEDYGTSTPRYEIDEDQAYEDHCLELMAQDRRKIAEILKEHIFSTEDLLNKLTDYAWEVRRNPEQ
jgi:hypothetical protein